MRIIVPLDAESEDALLRGEGGLDPEWYLETYPDVARAGMDPYFHYLVHGWREGRDPRSDFLTRFYLMTNPDVARLHINPLVHYLAYGKREGRLPAPEPRSASGDDIVVLNGVEILIDPTVMSEHMQWAIQYGQLSMPEASLIGRIVEQGDRFVELGAGIGYTSAVVALQGKAETITVVEANP